MAPRQRDFGIADDEIRLIARELGVEQPGVIQRAIIQVVNDAIDETQALAVRRITEAVNLTPEYILKHLKVSKRASKNSDSAVLSATVRGVLLSRFDSRQEFGPSRDPRGRTKGRVKRGVSVAVAPGVRHTMASAFLIKLKGSGVTGIAVRPKDQAQLKKKEWAEVGKRGYAVLHGPSVDQLFKSALDKGELEPDLETLASEFLRRIASV